MTSFDNSALDLRAYLLIVDDEPNIRTALVRVLTLLGYMVEEAGSGQEALRLLEQRPFDFMLLDIRMPGMDGVELMQRAKQIYPDLLIVILTGHATLESAIAAVKAEAVDYLLKPANAQQIADKVARVLQRRVGQRQRQQLTQIIGEVLNLLHQAETPLVTSVAPTVTVDHLLSFYSLTLDRQKRLVMATGRNQMSSQPLTEGETTILASLMIHPEQVLSCRDLVQTGWGYGLSEHEAENIVRPHICRLRHKIGSINPELTIYTVRKRGYVLRLVPQ